MQEQFTGKYSANCSYYSHYYDYDSLGNSSGLITDFIEYTDIFEVDGGNDNTILFDGISYDLVSKDDPYSYKGPMGYMDRPIVKFIEPDSIYYRYYGGGHFGSHVDCYGKKQ